MTINGESVGVRGRASKAQGIRVFNKPGDPRAPIISCGFFMVSFLEISAVDWSCVLCGMFSCPMAQKPSRLAFGQADHVTAR